MECFELLSEVPAKKMKMIHVLGLVSSRLQADIVMIRLRRVGIDCGKISAVFTRKFMPNTVACWLSVRQRLGTDPRFDSVMAAGPLREELAKLGNDGSLAELIEGAGFGRGVAAAVGERLMLGDTMLCVHARGDAEAAIAWHVFKHCRAEMIAMGGSQAEVEPLPAESFAAA